MVGSIWFIIVETARYWGEIVSGAFWKSLLLFLEDPKSLALLVVGAAASTFIVWLFRSREALTEHIKSNIFIALGGAFLTWFLVFVVYFVREPFIKHQELSNQLNVSAKRERAAVIGRRTAEIERDQVAKMRRNGFVKQDTLSRNSSIGEQSPPAQPATQLDRLIAINKNLSKDDRNRLSNALYDITKLLREANTLWGDANQEGGRLFSGWQTGSIVNDVEVHRRTLHGMDLQANNFAKTFSSVRGKWDYFPAQLNYIFGDNPDNEGPNALINAISGYANYLDRWVKIANKEQRPILDLFQEEQNDFNIRMTGFAHWRQGSEHRLDDMKQSIQ